MPTLSIYKALLNFLLTVIILAYVSTATAAVTTFSYDELDRLQQVDYDNGTYFITYDYDELGNRRYIYASDTALNLPPAVYHITASSTGNGYIFPSGVIPVIAGGSVTFTFSANPNHYLSDVLVNGFSAGIVGTYTFSSVTSDHTVSARFITPDGDVAPVGYPNGIIDTGDVVIASRIASGAEPLTLLALAHGDVYPQINGHPAPDGLITQDDVNLINQKSQGTITWDTSDSSVVHQATGTVTINGGATVTGNTAVMLSLSCSDSAGRCSHMQFSNDNVNWSNTEAYAGTKAWNLTSSDGHKVVYAIFRDVAGHWLTGSNATIRLDTMPPMTTATPTGFASNASQSITLACRDGAGSGCSKIYYTTDGSYPTTSSSVYSSPLNIAATTALNYLSTDLAGNIEPFKSQTYIIDTTSPVTFATPSGQFINSSLYIALYCNDYLGSGCANIYYTTDGTTPTTSSSIYSIPININATSTVKCFATDVAGNIGPVKNETYTMDTTLPSGSISINQGASYAKAEDVILNLSCSDNIGCYLVNLWNDQPSQGGTPYEAVKQWQLLPGDGTKTVQARFLDNAGNWSQTYSSSIFLDTAAAITTATPAGGAYNVTQSVTLACQDGAGSGCDKVYYTIDGTLPTTSSPIYSSHISMPTSTTLNYFATDQAGNIAVVKTQNYVIDTAPPVSIAAPAAGIYATTQAVTLSCDDGPGAGCDKIHYTTDGSQPTTSSLLYSGPINITANTALQFFAVDLSGNSETVKSQLYVIDTVAPSGTVTIGAGAAYTDTSIVTLAISCTDNAGTCKEMQFSNDSVNWSTPETFAPTKAWTLANGDGTKTVNARFKDIAGIWSTTVSDTIVLDTTAPGVTISSPSGTTDDSTPLLSYTVSDGTVVVKVDGNIVNKTSGSSLDTLANGSHVLHIEASDEAGNMGSAEVAFTVSTSVVINNDDFETGNLSRLPWVTTGNGLWAVNSSRVHGGTYAAQAPVSITNGQSATMQVTVNCAAGNISFWYSVSSEEDDDELLFYIDGVQKLNQSGEVPWTQATFAVAAGSHTFKWVYDKDYISSDGADTAWVDDIVFPVGAGDTPPTGTISINGGMANTKTTAVTLSLSCTDDAGVCNQMQFSNDNISWSTQETYAMTKAWTLATGDGTKTVYAKFRDVAGNWSAASSDTIVLDTIAPSVAITSPATGTTTDNTPLLTYTASDGTVVVKVDGNTVSKVSGNSLDTLANGSHVVRVEATDAAGNTGFAEVTFTVSAPVSVNEDFETGNLTRWPWATSGNGLWAVNSSRAHGGTYAAQAPVSITNDQSAAMQVTVNCTAGNISFWYSVSSEAGWDYLIFYIDGVQKLNKSGEISWTSASYPVSAGSHTFKWVYSKDDSSSEGSDTAWVDDIVFPVP